MTPMLYEARPAWRYQWVAFLGAALSAAALVLILLYGQIYTTTTLVRYGAIVAGALCVYLGLLIVYRRFLWRFTLSDELIESRRGMIARELHSIRVQDLRNVNVRQSFFQRLFGVGDVEFSSAGGAGVEVMFYGVTDPLGVKDRVLRPSNR